MHKIYNNYIQEQQEETSWSDQVDAEKQEISRPRTPRGDQYAPDAITFEPSYEIDPAESDQMYGYNPELEGIKTQETPEGENY